MFTPVNTSVQRRRRHRRVRSRISGTPECPRVTVFRSLRSLSTQLIDDTTGRTLAQANLAELRSGKQHLSNTVENAQKIGALLGERILAQKITRVVFDRSGYRYHGRVKAVADGLRAAGVQC